MNDQKYLELVDRASEKGRCKRRKIGCVLVDAPERVAIEGWNGPPSCMPSCFDEPCPAADVPAGTGPQTGCLGVHAEISALLKWPSDASLHTCYCNKMPCNSCVLTLLETDCRRIVCKIPANDKTGAELWTSMGRELIYA